MATRIPRRHENSRILEFHRPKGKNVTLPPVRINDVVILHHQGTSKRAFWKLARITELIRGRDGKVRGARVLVAGKKTPIERPLQELFPLEVHASNTESTNPNSITEDQPKIADSWSILGNTKNGYVGE